MKNSHDYDDGIRQKFKAGESRRGAVLRARNRRPDVRRRSAWSNPRGDQPGRRLGVARGLTQACLRHREHHRGGAGTSRAGGPAQPLHQESRHPRGHPRHPGGDLRRCTINVTRSSRASNTWRRPSVYPRHRATRSRRLESAGGLGCLAVRQPLGRGGGGEGAREPREPAGYRDRGASYKAYRDLLASDRWLRLLNAGGARAAHVMGKHRHQGYESV